MNFKLKSLPEIITWSETRQCKIEDESGKEIGIIITESPSETSVLVWNGDEDVWEEDEDGTIADWVQRDMDMQEMQLISDSQETNSENEK